MRARVRPVVVGGKLALGLVLFTMAFFAAPAGAQVRGTAMLSGGFTDNTRGTTGSSSASALAIARLGVDGVLLLPAASHTLSAAASATTYAQNAGASTLLATLRERSTFTLTPPLTVGVGASGTYAAASDPAAPPRLAPDGTPLPSMGSQLQSWRRYLLLDVSEDLVWTVTPGWSVRQSASATLFLPDGGSLASNQALYGRLAPGLALRRDVISLPVEVGIGWRGATEVAGVSVPAQRIGPYVDARLDWRHELNWAWAGHAAAGAVAYPSGDGTTVSPSVEAGLSWSAAPRSARLVVAHTARPQIFLGTIVLLDSAALSADIRLGRAENVRLGAVATAARGTVTDTFGATSSYRNLESRLAASWLPWPARAVDVSLSYSLLLQTADVGTTTQSYRRNTVLLSITVGLPTVRTEL